MSLSLTQTQVIEPPHFKKIKDRYASFPEYNKDLVLSIIEEEDSRVFLLKRKGESDTALRNLTTKKSQPTVRIEHDENFFKNIQRVAKRSK